MAPKARTSLTSLERLERQLLPITPSRAQGDAWEKALKGWINAGGHPELTKAWMWGEWPGKLKAGLKGDKGVDLVAETRDKQLVAIQVKFRENPNDPVTAPEVQKLVGSYRKHFTLFALASNAWSATRGVSEAVGDEDAMLILREQLLESSYDWAAKKSIKRTKFTPFPFQKVAAENVRKALEKGGRAQIVMACGTGKTVTMLLAAEALDAQRVLVLAPTLLLVKQLRDEWISKRRPDREWASLAVCSDIGDGVDASEIAPAEFGAPPTTNPDDIAAFLKKPGRRVVFGTYASSDRIAKAQKKAGVPSFDLAVADEAHRIAGVVSAKDKSERSQRVMLEEKEIKAVRRLFATATPRITGSKKTRDGDDILIESMDDEVRFGKVAHSVTFREAVILKRLVPYKLVVTIVTKDEVDDLIKNRQFIDVKGQTYPADEVATAIAIRRAYKDLGISKIISYHSRVAGARAFADLIAQVPGRGKPPVTEHVAGSMPVNDRRQVLNRLAAATEPYLVTNARCLTEGVDVPALDAVAFADPRRSQVDIVQAVGRAMRRPMGTSKKTTGYIILPVYLTRKELKDPETAVEGSAFEPVLQVLRALKDHDPFMARFMAKILVERGKRPHKKGQGIDEILEVSISKSIEKELAAKLLAAVQLRAIEVTSERFEVGLLALRAFHARTGHFRVPGNHLENGINLSNWVSVRRLEYRDGRLSPERIAALEATGLPWDAFDDLWEQGFLAISNYSKTHGDCRVPNHYEVDGFALSTWVYRQRRTFRTGELPEEKVSRLNRLGFVWDAKDDVIERAIAALISFKKRTGHVKVPRGHLENGFALGAWASSRRMKVVRDRTAPELLKRLQEIGFELVPHDASYERGGKYFKEFVKENGHALVPSNYRVDGFHLGQWVVNIRARRVKGQLSEDRIQQLDKLGIVWSVQDVKWAELLVAFRSFRAREGHLAIPLKHHEGDVPLGSRLNYLRAAKRSGALSAQQISDLESLGIDWNPKDTLWETGLKVLVAYKKRTGHCRVPYNHVENGFKLGNWRHNRIMLRRKGYLSADKIKALDALGFVWVNE